MARTTSAVENGPGGNNMAEKLRLDLTIDVESATILGNASMQVEVQVGQQTYRTANETPLRCDVTSQNSPSAAKIGWAHSSSRGSLLEIAPSPVGLGASSPMSSGWAQDLVDPTGRAPSSMVLGGWNPTQVSPGTSPGSNTSSLSPMACLGASPTSSGFGPGLLAPIPAGQAPSSQAPIAPPLIYEGQAPIILHSVPEGLLTEESLAYVVSASNSQCLDHFHLQLIAENEELRARCQQLTEEKAGCDQRYHNLVNHMEQEEGDFEDQLRASEAEKEAMSLRMEQQTLDEIRTKVKTTEKIDALKKIRVRKNQEVQVIKDTHRNETSEWALKEDVYKSLVQNLIDSRSQKDRLIKDLSEQVEHFKKIIEQGTGSQLERAETNARQRTVETGTLEHVDHGEGNSHGPQQSGPSTSTAAKTEVENDFGSEETGTNNPTPCPRLKRHHEESSSKDTPSNKNSRTGMAELHGDVNLN